jgi:hypothetical protein
MSISYTSQTRLSPRNIHYPQCFACIITLANLKLSTGSELQLEAILLCEVSLVPPTNFLQLDGQGGRVNVIHMLMVLAAPCQTSLEQFNLFPAHGLSAAPMSLHFAVEKKAVLTQVMLMGKCLPYAMRHMRLELWEMSPVLSCKI